MHPFRPSAHTRGCYARLVCTHVCMYVCVARHCTCTYVWLDIDVLLLYMHMHTGVFWIDLNSLCAFFDVLYVNWRPAMFKNKWKVHGYDVITWAGHDDVITRL